MEIEGAIFDMDGTLLDSMPAWDRVGADYLESRGVQPPPDLRAHTRNLSLAQGADYFKSRFGLPESRAEIMAGMDKVIERAYRSSIGPKAGAAALLETLQARGVRVCLATATDRYLVELALTRCGLRDYFAEIFTCGQVGSGKDQPLIFHKALAFLGTEKAKTWVFEDALYAVRTAKAAGFPVAALRDGSEPGQEQLRQLADLYCEDLHAMRALFA